MSALPIVVVVVVKVPKHIQAQQLFRADKILVKPLSKL